MPPHGDPTAPREGAPCDQAIDADDALRTLTALGFGGPITSGTFTMYILVDSVGLEGLPGGNNRAPQFGMATGACCSRGIEVDVFSESGGGARLRVVGGTNFGNDTSIPTEAMRWTEWRMSYDRTAGTVELSYRDVNDTDGSIPAPTFIAHSASPASVAGQNIENIYLRGFRGVSPPNGRGRYDRISSTPLPEPTALGLMAIGGIMILRRRRRA